MCVKGLNAGTGMFLDGTFRFHLGRWRTSAARLHPGHLLRVRGGSRSTRASRWADDIPFEIGAAGSAAAWPTGWGSAVYAAGVRAGGHRGRSSVRAAWAATAVQGARYAGAKNVVVVDPVAFKRDMAKTFGATHTFATAAEAHDFIVDTTWGQLADHAILTPGVLTGGDRAGCGRGWSARAARSPSPRSGR